MHWLFVIEFPLFGLLLIGASIPLILRRIPPNWIYGFKLPKTVNNPDIWYKANECSGKLMAIAGAVITLASVVLGMLGMSDHAYLTLMILVATVSLGITVIASLIYLKTL